VKNHRQSIIEKISKNYGLTVIDCSQINYSKQAKMEKDDFANCSFIIDDQIILGNYDNTENKELSFFHELGHLFFRRHTFENIYDMERAAWSIGLKIAATHGIRFSFRSKKWAVNQLNTYVK